jgi:hypothetical protein
VLGHLVLVDDLPGALGDTAAAAPRRAPRGLVVLAVILSSSASVAPSSSVRLRARWAATAGLRQTISRSPGKRSLVISARLT